VGIATPRRKRPAGVSPYPRDDRLAGSAVATGTPAMSSSRNRAPSRTTAVPSRRSPPAAAPAPASPLPRKAKGILRVARIAAGKRAKRGATGATVVDSFVRATAAWNDLRNFRNEKARTTQGPDWKYRTDAAFHAELAGFIVAMVLALRDYQHRDEERGVAESGGERFDRLADEWVGDDAAGKCAIEVYRIAAGGADKQVSRLLQEAADTDLQFAIEVRVWVVDNLPRLIFDVPVSTALPAGHADGAEVPTLTPPDLSILKALWERRPATMTLYELETTTDPPVSRKTAGQRVKYLIANGLAARPHGVRKGTSITPKGSGLLSPPAP
jgi:hypothetical protein